MVIKVFGGGGDVVQSDVTEAGDDVARHRRANESIKQREHRYISRSLARCSTSRRNVIVVEPPSAPPPDVATSMSP